jgi:16S rRNA (adenine1518-N6/adenine1519-N6)-dimethyltransferase
MSELTHISYIRRLLERHNFTFDKRLGQNFLVNPGVCPRMAELGGAGPGMGVLEIGPGIGVLSRELCLRSKRVVAVEIDPRLPPVLAETMAAFDNFRLIEGDVLDIDLSALIAEHFADCEGVVVCANLPYYITTPVITRLLEHRLPVQAVTVMVQKEAALRLTAPPGDRACGAISAAIWYYSQPRMLFSVSPGSFMPPPKVQSAVVRMDIRPQPPVTPLSEAAFFRTVRAAFAQRRKTVLNSVASSLGAPKPAVAAAMESAGIDSGLRAERLDMAALSALSDGLLTAGLLPGLDA